MSPSLRIYAACRKLRRALGGRVREKLFDLSMQPGGRIFDLGRRGQNGFFPRRVGSARRQRSGDHETDGWRGLPGQDCAPVLSAMMSACAASFAATSAVETAAIAAAAESAESAAQSESESDAESRA